MEKDTIEHNFLTGGGEMGALIRAKDWSTTPLGDPETWPQSLKTMVSVMLNNPFGMYIAWGKEYIQLYNDAYRPILGSTKHPKALGTGTKESYYEVWDFAGTQFDEVMKGNAISYSDYKMPLNRHGYLETCYFDFAYSPIKLPSGEVGGVLVTIIETTTKRKAEENLQDSKNELEFVIDASQLATFDYESSTNKFSGNARLKDWFGLPPDEHLELHHGTDVIVERDRDRVAKAIRAALEYSSNGIYDVEYTIANPITKKEMIVHAKGRAWFDDDDTIAYRLNGTLEDVTNRVLARKKIEESERSLRLMVLQAPVAIAIFRGANYNVEIANKYALNLWDKSEKEVLNISIFESMPELLSQGLKRLMDEVIMTGKRYEVAELPITMRRKGIMETVYVNFSYEPLYDANGVTNGIMLIGYDITPQVEARKKIEESEQNMRALVESAPFPIAVYMGEEMRIILANQSIMDTWGKGNDIIGKLYSDILPELEKQQIFKQIRDVYHTGKPFHAKTQRVDLIKNGSLTSHYFDYSFIPLMDAAGNIQSVMNTAADVTELNEAKRKVEESEKRFRHVVKQAPVGIAIFRGSDYVVEMANETYLQLVDKTEDIFVGKPLFESLPELKATLENITIDIYRTGVAYRGYEFPVTLYRHGRKELCYFNFVYHPLKELNIITGIMVVATEVTATVKARHLIEENEEKLNLIIEGSELGMFDANLKTSEIVASDRSHVILGFSKKRNLSPKELLANIHPEDLEFKKKHLKRALVTGKLHHQVRVIWEDDSLHWIDVKGKVFYDARNKAERLLGTIRDISEERNFQQQILEREEKFRLLADSLPQQVWTANPKGNLNYFNQTVFDYSGLPLKKLIKSGWLDMVHPDDRKENMEVWTHSVSTGEDFLLEHRFRKHNGEYRWQLSRAIPQRDANGKIKMWVGSSTDIQEQKMFTTELENMVKMRTKELEQKNLDLEDMNKELQSFVYISSHDLQEPLRKIQTFSSRILETEYEQLSPNAKKHFSRMQKSAFRMQNLIQDLIAYSRTNVPELKFESVDLNIIIDDVKETLSEDLEQNHVVLNLHNICDVRIIPVQFKQVLHNLISNSIKFARVDQGVVIDINCEIIDGKDKAIEALLDDRKYCHLRYSDNGIGFEPEYKEKIFEVFQRLHSKDDYTGTGIGLAIVKRIIENHQGFIQAQGNLGEGAEFNIYIPIE